MESILAMISMWRGSSLVMTFTGHFSRASGMTVWLVKARVCTKGQAVRTHVKFGSSGWADAKRQRALRCTAERGKPDDECKPSFHGHRESYERSAAHVQPENEALEAAWEACKLEQMQLASSEASQQSHMLNSLIWTDRHAAWPQTCSQKCYHRRWDNGQQQLVGDGKI